MLRSKYLARENGYSFTFHSVILAGVYDIRNIKLKLVNEGIHSPLSTEGKIYNSPWNIAAKFNVDMSFNPNEIETMLNEYQNESLTDMDTRAVSQEIYKFTDGYPFLVSNICKIIDEELNKDWSVNGVMKAVKITLDENNTLFEDLSKNLENYKSLYDFIYSVLIIGEAKKFNIDDPVIALASMFGYVKNCNGKVSVTNKIFEIRISEYFLSKDMNVNHDKKEMAFVLQQDIVRNNIFDMELCLRKFAEHYHEIFTEEDAKFLKVRRAKRKHMSNY